MSFPLTILLYVNGIHSTFNEINQNHNNREVVCDTNVYENDKNTC